MLWHIFWKERCHKIAKIQNTKKKFKFLGGKSNQLNQFDNQKGAKMWSNFYCAKNLEKPTYCELTFLENHAIKKINLA